METAQYLRALARSWWLFLLTVLASGAGGFLVYHQATPMYRSTIRVIVASNSGGTAIDEVTLQALAAQRATSFAHIASTPPPYPMQRRLRGTRTTCRVWPRIPNGTDPFITISVDDTNPTRAQSIAGASEDQVGIRPEETGSIAEQIVQQG